MPSPTLVRDEPATKRFPIHARHLPIDQSNTKRVFLVEAAKTAWRASVAFADSPGAGPGVSRDQPQAAADILIFPRKHIGSLAADDHHLLGYLHLIAASEGLANGFRTVFDTGCDDGPRVDDLHVYLPGGRPIRSPAG